MRSSRLVGRGWMIVLAVLFALLPVVARAQGGTYTVRSGDTLRSIAAAHGTTAAAIARVNGLSDPDTIRVGQQLSLPAGGVASGTTAQASGSGALYSVKPGDTLAVIAARFGVSVRAIVQANNIADPNVLRVGAQLAIPGAQGGANVVQSAVPAGSSYNKPGGGPQNYLDPTRFAVSISKQHCWLLEDDELTGSWPCSTGRRNAETVPGFYTVRSLIPKAWGAAWGFWMPYWLGFYTIGPTENGIHGLPYNQWGKDWEDKIGTPISFGCVVLDDAAAEKLYSVAYIGMQVIVLP